jgi:hypothetical protein
MCFGKDINCDGSSIVVIIGDARTSTCCEALGESYRRGNDGGRSPGNHLSALVRVNPSNPQRLLGTRAARARNMDFVMMTVFHLIHGCPFLSFTEPV